jgi:hypothetical protein
MDVIANDVIDIAASPFKVEAQMDGAGRACCRGGQRRAFAQDVGHHARPAFQDNGRRYPAALRP